MIEKNCKTCGTRFNAIKEAQFFCSRKCFKRDYYKRNKAKQEALALKRPTYKCSACGGKSEMPFDPVKNYAEFGEFKCPLCKIPRAELVDKEKKKTILDYVGGDHIVSDTFGVD